MADATMGAAPVLPGAGSKQQPAQQAAREQHSHKTTRRDGDPPPRKLRGKELVDQVASLMAEGGAGAPGGQQDDPPQEQGLQEQDAEDREAPQPGDEGELQGEDQPTTMDDVQRALGLSRRALNGVQIKVGEQTVTLGELKEMVPRLASLDAERAEFADRVTATELEQIDGHRRLMALVDALPANSIPPGLLQRLELQHAEKREREAELLNRARPAWGDPKYASAERDAMGAVAMKYGFSRAELAAIVDHRQVLLLQDFAHALARIEAAKGAARRVEPVGDKKLTTDAPRAAESGRPGSNGTGNLGVSKKAQMSRRVADLIARG